MAFDLLRIWKSGLIREGTKEVAENVSDFISKERGREAGEVTEPEESVVEKVGDVFGTVGETLKDVTQTVGEIGAKTFETAIETEKDIFRKAGEIGTPLFKFAFGEPPTQSERSKLSYLETQKITGETLSEDEQEEYDRLNQKVTNFDLSVTTSIIPGSIVAKGGKTLAKEVIESGVKKEAVPFFIKWGEKILQNQGVQRVRQKMVNELAVLDDFTRNIVRGISDLPGAANPSQLAHNYAGAIGKANQMVTNLGKSISRSYGTKSIRQEFTEYLKNKRIIEVIEQKGLTDYNGITKEQAESTINGISQKLGDKRFAELQDDAQKMYDFSSGLLKYASDVVGTTVVDDLLQKYPSYVRFQLLEFMDDAAQKMPYGSKGFKTKADDIVQELKGKFEAGKTILDPVDSTAKMAYQVVNAVEKNKVVQALVNLRNMSEDASQLILDVGELKRQEFIKKLGGNKRLQDLFEDTKIMKEVDEFIETNSSFKSDVQEAGFKSLSDFWTQAKEGSKIDIPDDMNSIYAFFDGVKREFFVPKDLAEAVNGMNQVAADSVSKFGAAMSRMLKAGATLYSPTFIVRNLFRDFENAKVIMSDFSLGQGFGLKDWLKGFSEAVKKGPEYQMWVDAGGSFSTLTSQLKPIATVKGKQIIQTGIKQAAKPTWVKGIKTVTNPLELMRIVGGVIEEAPRLGVFKKAQKLGKDVTEAAYLSRNVTVDFNRAGTVGRIMNMWIPFFNPRLQGIANFQKAMAKHPVRTLTRSMYSIGLPAAITYAWNKQFPEFDDLSERDRQENFIIMLGGFEDKEGNVQPRAVKIPKGDVAKLFGNPIEAFLEYTSKNDPEALRGLLLEFLDVQSPISFARRGKFDPKLLASSILPPPIKAGIEGAYNVNLYTGRPIISDEELQKASAELQYTKTTPESLKAITYLLASKGVELSPAKIYQVLGTMTGEAGRLPFYVADLVMNVVNGKKTELTKEEQIALAPILRAFYTVSGGEKDVIQHELLTSVEKEKATEAIQLEQIAEDYYLAYKLLEDPKEQYEYLKTLVEKEGVEKGNKIIKELKSIQEKEDQGLNSVERRLLYFGVENRERANGVAALLNDMESMEERKRYLDELKIKGVVTPEVFGQLEELKRQGIVDY